MVNLLICCMKHGNYTFHDLRTPDTNLAGLVPPQRSSGVGVNDLDLGVANHRPARTRFDLIGLLCKAQAHGDGPGLRHSIPLYICDHAQHATFNIELMVLFSCTLILLCIYILCPCSCWSVIPPGKNFKEVTQKIAS